MSPPSHLGETYYFTHVCLSVRLSVTDRVHLITLKHYEIISRYLVQIFTMIRQCAEDKNHNFTYIINEIMHLCYFQCENRVCSTILKPFKVFSRNLVHI